MKITGELLKAERIKLNLTHLDIASSLKLSAKTIRSIEEGDLENLPAKTFVRGFVKSYAELLKLDSKVVLNQYHEEVGVTQPQAKMAAQNASVQKSRPSLESTAEQNKNISTIEPQFKNSFNKNTIKTILLIVSLVVALGAINQIINKYQKEVQTSAETTDSQNETEKKPTANSTEIPTHNELQSLIVPSETSTTAASNENVTPMTSAEITPTEVLKEDPKKADLKSIELVIEAIKDTVVFYSIGEEVTFKSIELKKDTFQIIKSKNGLKIKVEEGNSVNLTINGKNKGPASSDSKPILLSF